MAKFNVVAGDKVAYSVQFLRSIGMSHSDMARARGVVETVDTYGAGPGGCVMRDQLKWKDLACLAWAALALVVIWAGIIVAFALDGTVTP